MNLRKLLFFTMFTSSFMYAQKADTLYLKYHKNMSISDSGDEIILSFALKGTDVKYSTYNFKIDNLTQGFQLLQFNEIKDTISINHVSKLKQLDLSSFSEYSACDLHLLFSDEKTIYVIRNENNRFYRYKLFYWSTQRGWTKIEN